MIACRVSSTAAGSAAGDAGSVTVSIVVTVVVSGGCVGVVGGPPACSASPPPHAAARSRTRSATRFIGSLDRRGPRRIQRWRIHPVPRFLLLSVFSCVLTVSFARRVVLISTKGRQSSRALAALRGRWLVLSASALSHILGRRRRIDRARDFLRRRGGR